MISIPLVRVSRLCVARHAGVPGCTARVRVLTQVELDVYAGDVLLIVGAAGVGKTTLLASLCGLLPLEAGDVRWAHGVRPCAVPLRRAGLGSLAELPNAAPSTVLLVDGPPHGRGARRGPAWPGWLAQLQEIRTAVVLTSRDESYSAGITRLMLLHGGSLRELPPPCAAPRRAMVAERVSVDRHSGHA